MPWADFLEMMAFNSISPIGDERADFVSAFHTAAIINANRSGGEPLDLQELIPFQSDEERADAGMITPETPEDEMDAVMGLFSAMKMVRAKKEG